MIWGRLSSGTTGVVFEFEVNFSGEDGISDLTSNPGGSGSGNIIFEAGCCCFTDADFLGLPFRLKGQAAAGGFLISFADFDFMVF